MFACSALLALLSSPAAAADWAVLVAASFQYNNYRHQSDVCRAYHVLSARGIPDSNIIVMLYDDVANEAANPFPGTLYNTPSGDNVYAGCKKDYVGTAVSSTNFLAVLSGDAAAVPANKPVLASTSDDNVFIFYADHGAAGFLAFPASHLYAADLNAALAKGHAKGLWRKAVFYVEACEAGSMFDQILDPALGVYVVTASNPTESSWGVNCPPFDYAHGRPIGSCLGDLFAVTWMNDTLGAGEFETLGAQFEATRARVAEGTGGLYPQSSHVMQYGNVAVADELVADFQGLASNGRAVAPVDAVGAIAARDVPLHLAYYRYLRTDRSNLAVRRAATMALRAQLDAQLAADDHFLAWATSITGDEALAAELVSGISNGPSTDCGICCPTVHELYRKHCGGYDGYSIQYARLVSNVCAYSGGDGSSLGAALVAGCSGGSLPVVV